MSSESITENSWYAKTAAESAQALQVDPATGLTAGEAQQRLQKYGPNILAAAKKETGLQAFSAPVPGSYADHPAGGGGGEFCSHT